LALVYILGSWTSAISATGILSRTIIRKLVVGEKNVIARVYMFLVACIKILAVSAPPTGIADGYAAHMTYQHATSGHKAVVGMAAHSRAIGYSPLACEPQFYKGSTRASGLTSKNIIIFRVEWAQCSAESVILSARVESHRTAATSWITKIAQNWDCDLQSN
jgi:hypothetical protein